MALRLAFLFCVALVLTVTTIATVTTAEAETRNRSREQQRAAVPTATRDRAPPLPTRAPAAARPAQPVQQTPPAQTALPTQPAQPVRPRPGAILTAITLADIGFGEGFRFANLGGRRELFVPLPQGADIIASELVLVFDDISAHEARRSVEVLLNDRTVAAIPLDGKGQPRTVRIPLGQARAREGFLKITFMYSGASTPDRCIDVRYVGDSLTVRPETALEIDIVFPGSPDVSTTVALMPRDVSVVVPRRRLEASDIAIALTVARSLAATGRRVTFVQGFENAQELARGEDRRWTKGIVLVGPLHEAMAHLDKSVATFAGAPTPLGTLVAARVGGFPVLVVSDAHSVRAGRLLGTPNVHATRGVGMATVGDLAGPRAATAQIGFERLAIPLSQAEVFGRADLPVVIDVRALPAGTRPVRLMLDVMVAPDGSGEKAVVSAFVNERLLNSVVAATSEPTRIDLALPDGLVGTVASVRVIVQRRSAQGDCRFEPQGYPAQILGSSAVVLETVDAPAREFSDLIAHWANSVEIHVPPSVQDRPLPALTLLADVLTALTPDSAVITVRISSRGEPMASAPFIAVSELPPSGSTPRVRFDRGRVVVADRGGQPLLDLGGFAGGAVAQVVNAGGHAGMWIRPLATDGSLPAPTELRLDRGDVAFVDQTGVALALSTERERLVHVTYPDQVSWLTIADRFRPWLFGALWVFATVLFLLGLRRILRRRPTTLGE